MPIITAFPNPTLAQVRVEINWADTPAVTHAGVQRYNTVTGECVPLRPYICYEGWDLELSCGHGIFFDTEAPLDTEFYYITTSDQAPCIPTAPIMFDTFTRVVVDGWGSPTVGNPYTNAGGAAADYDVNGTQGTHLLNTVDVMRHSTSDIGTANFDIYGEVTIPVTATGAPISTRLIGRFTDVNNFYSAELAFQTSGSAQLGMRATVAAVTTNIGSTVVVGTYLPGDRWAIRFQGAGPTFSAKAWNLTLGQPEPDQFRITGTSTVLTTGNQVGVGSRLNLGNLDSPQTIPWDNLSVTLPCDPCDPVTVDTSADPTTLVSNGTFWLRDPVRPCHDQNVPLCFTQANTAMDALGYCLPGNGIFFASMDTEVREPNTLTLNPTNAQFPLAMTRTRRGISSLLTLVTRTFDDRDNVITLAEPGSPLFWQGPANYGIIDQYLNVGALAFERGLSDHKFQVRIATLPYIQVGRPAGPSQGVCGSQVSDYCDFTWDELAAGGFNWDDLIRGTPNGSTAGYRTWTVGTNTVLADFADWDAVNTAGRTWTDLEVGL